MENESKYPKEIMDIIGDDETDMELFEHKLKLAKELIHEKGYDAQLKFAKNMFLSDKKHFGNIRSELKKNDPVLYEKFYGNK
jgi:hypothetical protein